MTKTNKEIGEHLDNAKEADITIHYGMTADNVEQIYIRYSITLKNDAKIFYPRTMTKTHGNYPRWWKETQNQINKYRNKPDIAVNVHILGSLYGDYDYPIQTLLEDGRVQEGDIILGE